MKILGIMTFILMVSAAFGQKKYTIEGRVGSVAPNAAVELVRFYGNIGETIGLDTIRNGRFSFRGETDQLPARMSIGVVGDSSYYGERFLWIEEDVVEIEGNGAGVSLWKVNSKSKLQLEENEFLEHTACFVAAFNQLRHEKQQEYLDEMRDQRKKVPEMTDYPVQRALDSLSKSSLQAELQLLKRRAVLSEVGMEKLYPFAREIFYSKHPRFPREEIRQVFLRLDPALKNTPRAIEIQNYLYPCDVVGVGDEMADGILFDLQGKEHRLSDYKGKYLLLDFWNCACGPCIAAHPELNELAEMYRDRLYVISISLDTSKRLWKDASGKLNGINLSDLKGEGGIAAKYKFEGTPKYVIINPGGKIVEQWVGYGKGVLKNKMAKYLN